MPGVVGRAREIAMDAAGAVALVTGGASGLGEATVRRLAAGGARVVIVDRDTTRGPALAEALGTAVAFAEADVTMEDEVQAAVALAGELGPVRIVVNCAGIGAAGRMLGKDGPMPLARFRKVVEVNLIGTFNVCRLAAGAIALTEPLADGERGVIVNTASVAAFDGQIGQAAYSASKGGIVGMTLPIARELARTGIRIMTIAPGTFDTPLFDTLPAGARDALAADIPFPHRLGHASEYADLVAHIVANPYLNGTTIRLDGAIRMPPK
jgi:NAD(P)-dependent dehydrogenase (short-subunit alcohol dehydrogenase family)